MMNVDVIADRLIADATLVGTLSGGSYSGLAKGGIWTKKLKRGTADEPGATPTAFDADMKIKPSIVVLDEGDSPHRQRPWIPGAYVQQIWIYFYARAHQTGKETIVAMRKRVYELLDHAASNGWVFASEDGPIVFPEYIDRRGIRDSETFTEAVEDYQRFGLTSRYAALV